MRCFRTIFARTAVLLALAAAAVLLLAACGGEPKVERVDVTWVSMDPSPRWGLYPGYRQELQFKKGSAFQVDVYSGGKVVTGGIVGDTGYALAFRPTAGAKDIESEAAGTTGLNLYVTLRTDKGDARRLLCLKVERREDKMYFEVPK